ncbi:hypothetical protein BN1708_000197, partial [Verticillium longisporum]
MSPAGSPTFTSGTWLAARNLQPPHRSHNKQASKPTQLPFLTRHPCDQFHARRNHPSKPPTMSRQSEQAQAFAYAVYAAVQEIPRGKVTSYGHIAALIGTPERPRQVGTALRHLPAAPAALPFHSANVPWQRVISARGLISPRGGGDGGDGTAAQAEALRAEGVDVQPFAYAVYAAVQEIPRGKVTSYGHIAALIGTRTYLHLSRTAPPDALALTLPPCLLPKAERPRQVGTALRHLPAAPAALPFHSANVPWQRVISARGLISPRGGGDGGDGTAAQAEALRAEGVDVQRRGLGELCVDLDVYGWFPEDLPSQLEEEGDEEE